MISKKLEKELDKILNSIEEPPYKIPKNWVWIALKHLGEINPKNTDITDDTEVSFVPMASVDDVTGEYKGQETKKWGEVKRGYTHMANGDVIFAKITPCMENGKCAVVKDLKNGYGAGSTEFHVIRPYKFVLPEYIHLFLRQESFRKYAEENMTGSAGQRRVPTKWFKEQMIPIPPIQEQRRIIEKVKKSFEKIDVIIENLSKAKELLKKRHESLLQKAFRGELSKNEIGSNTLNDLNEEIDKPYNIPSHWKWVQVKEVSEKIQYGYTASADNSITEVKFLRITDIKPDGVNWDEVPGCVIDEKNINKYKLSNNDILIARTGGTVGKSFIVKNPPLSTFASYLIRIKLKEDVLAEYFRYFLDTKYYWEYISLGKRGAAQPNVNATQLGNMLFPLPPMLEQKRIVEILDKESKKQKEILKIIEQAEEKLKKMRQSLLQKAFRGELVEQRPEEGTGLDLLKEIIEEKLKLNKEK